MVIPRTHGERADSLCPNHWDARQQCWTVAPVTAAQTARKGVYVAGDQTAAQCGAAVVAGIAGELAVWPWRSGQGGIGPEEFSGAAQLCCAPLAAADGIQGFLDAWFSPRKDQASCRTTGCVCRCGENVSGGYPEAVRRRPDRHQRSKACDAGGDVGNCQGRPGPVSWREYCGGNRAGAIPDMGAPACPLPCGPCAAFRLPRFPETKATVPATVNLPATRTSHAHYRLLYYRRLFSLLVMYPAITDEKGSQLTSCGRTQYAAALILFVSRCHLVCGGGNIGVFPFMRILQGSSCSSRLTVVINQIFSVVHLRARPQC